MSIRLLIVSMAWAIMMVITYINVTKPFAGVADNALWFAYLIVLTGIILWPRSRQGDRVEATDDGWSRAA
ncbi:MAG: hypothetical protein AAGG99_08155 [Pseudomonadota bacterium]